MVLPHIIFISIAIIIILAFAYITRRSDGADLIGVCPQGQTLSGGICEEKCPPGYIFDGYKCISESIGAYFNPNTGTFFNICPPFTVYRYDENLQRDFCDSPCTSDQYLTESGDCVPKCSYPKVWDGRKCVCNPALGLKEDSTGNCVETADKCKIGVCERKVINGINVCNKVPHTDMVGNSVMAFRCLLPSDEYLVGWGDRTYKGGYILTYPNGKCEAPFEVKDWGWGNALSCWPSNTTSATPFDLNFDANNKIFYRLDATNKIFYQMDDAEPQFSRPAILQSQY